LVTYIIKRVTTDNDIVLDFFSGSSTTAHATLNLNYEDKGHRRFIMIQLPEKTEDGSQAFKDGYYTICDIAKERIRRAGKLILNKASSTNQEVGLFSKDDDDYGKPDVGFRVLKLDTSNMNDVYYRPEEFNEQLIKEDNVKEDRNSEDLLFQVMLECNLPLSARIQSEKIAGKEVFSVNNGYLVACFDEDVNEEVIKAVAKRKPYYFVMRDSSLASDNVADNFEQIFQAYSKETIRRIL
jgi:adenine-specific DNA-methyltransferase